METQSCLSPDNVDAIGALYARQGFAVGPKVLDDPLIEAGCRAMDEVLNGRYETGIEPLHFGWKPGEDPYGKLRKVDQPHIANRTMFDIISNSKLGETVAGILGVPSVQPWCVQLLYKPAGLAQNNAVGWHQDYQYWQTWWTPESNVFTVWLALSDIDESVGPVCFVPGSHEWGLQAEGDFFSQDGTEQPVPPEGKEWNEVVALMPAGAFSIHHRLTYHGSRPNLSDLPRRSLAIHMRAEPSEALPQPEVDPDHGYVYTAHLDDMAICPVLTGRA